MSTRLRVMRHERGWSQAQLAELKTTRLPGLADYFSALDAAYACEDIDRLEELWTLVDVAWIRIPRTVRFVPVHNIESGYEHPFGVSPEFRLEARTDIDQGLIAARRIATASHAATFGLKQEVIDALAPKLAHRYRRLRDHASRWCLLQLPLCGTSSAQQT